ncbi:xanthine dehydrogenase iron-sulfur cluster and FAD-binding subunit A [Bradyrhizobium niftali]|uniref:hypothetical protein n=1 Tax=Bradyrhizobium niftali TaxID=2560055 RepID=UPI00383945A3
MRSELQFRTEAVALFSAAAIRRLWARREIAIGLVVAGRKDNLCNCGGYGRTSAGIRAAHQSMALWSATKYFPVGYNWQKIAGTLALEVVPSWSSSGVSAGE